MDGYIGGCEYMGIILWMYNYCLLYIYYYVYYIIEQFIIFNIDYSVNMWYVSMVVNYSMFDYVYQFMLLNDSIMVLLSVLGNDTIRDTTVYWLFLSYFMY